MNNQFTNDMKDMDELLKQTAESANPDAQFTDQLERSLKDIHHKKAAPGWFRFTRKQVFTTLAWTASLIAFVLFMDWTIRTVASIPTEIPASNETSAPLPTDQTNVVNETEGTPAPDAVGYDWRNTKLYLNEPLPDSPLDAEVYLSRLAKPATGDDVLALAQKFGINGEVKTVPGEFTIGSNYVINGDGNKRLVVRADHHFIYHSNVEQLSLENVTDERARSIADKFLKDHNFNFDYKFERAPKMEGALFYITPLLGNGSTIRFDYLNPWRYEITLDNTGENIIFVGYALEFEELGNFEIITAEEAFQKVLSQDPQTGLMEIFNGHGGGGGGSSFLQINPIGTPAVFPHPTPTIIIETPIVINDPAFTPPTATLEIIELAYHVRYPPYALADPSAGIQYAQPVWRFYGHYSNGDEFEILVQALKEAYLLPELAPYTPPG
ncbi:MAG TPA: hypothetical protein PKE62_07290 [Anaerolineales bacterium]|nr:hypothetical protein [Anaerolineales bacterium]